MFNRRTFLKSSAGVIPMASAINALDAFSTVSAEEMVARPANGSTPKLTPLPQRMAAIDPTTEPWQQKIRRVGQSNMTEHDPAVMNIEEWANYWRCCDAEFHVEIGDARISGRSNVMSGRQPDLEHHSKRELKLAFTVESHTVDLRGISIVYARGRNIVKS